ncbi:MAG: tetratricopeptide repeat protein, partial [Chitinophagaceae bacterium]|nr:tetratricopeptide repeat protein [Chitinophagaceae bacterium]
MTRYYICILFTLLSFSAFAGSKIDSLAAAADAEKDKELRFELYYKLAAMTISSDLQASIGWATKARSFAIENGLTDKIIKSNLILTSADIEAGYLDEAMTSAQSALDLSRQGDNYLYQYYSYRNMAMLYRRKANYDSALVNYMACLKVTEEHLGDTFVGYACSGLGSYYATIHNLEKAEEWHLRALQMCEQTKDTPGMADCYDNLGIINRDRGEYKKALVYYNKAREIYLTKGDSSDIAFIYNDLGAIYSKSGVLDSGEYFLVKSIEMRERMNELIELAYTYNYLGENYERKGDLEQGELYIKKALTLAIQIANNKQHYEALESLSDFYARNKMYDSAYKYLQLYKSYRDSIRQMDNEALIAELNTRYETEKKEKRIQEQEFQLTR